MTRALVFQLHEAKKQAHAALDDVIAGIRNAPHSHMEEAVKEAQDLTHKLFDLGRKAKTTPTTDDVVEIDSRADKILEGRNAGDYWIQVPVHQQITTKQVGPGKTIRDSTGATYCVIKTELSHKLSDPPIPAITLLVKT